MSRKLTDKEKIEVLKKCFEETIWMAIRYADGRKTYAPGMVRNAVAMFKGVFPDWKLKEDITIEKPKESELKSWSQLSDFLYDLFE